MNNKLTEKKGIQLNQAFGAVLAVVLVAVLVIVAIFLFDTLGDSFATTSSTVNNETGAFINSTGYTVDNAGACGFNNFAVIEATNVSNPALPVVILAANYTTTSIGVITNATTLEFPDVNLTYSYRSGGDSCDASQDMVTQFATYPALVGLVGTIIFLGLVIGVLVASFLFGGRPRP